MGERARARRGLGFWAGAAAGLAFAAVTLLGLSLSTPLERAEPEPAPRVSAQPGAEASRETAASPVASATPSPVETSSVETFSVETPSGETPPVGTPAVSALSAEARSVEAAPIQRRSAEGSPDAAAPDDAAPVAAAATEESPRAESAPVDAVEPEAAGSVEAASETPGAVSASTPSPVPAPPSRVAEPVATDAPAIPLFAPRDEPGPGAPVLAIALLFAEDADISAEAAFAAPARFSVTAPEGSDAAALAAGRGAPLLADTPEAAFRIRARDGGALAFATLRDAAEAARRDGRTTVTIEAGRATLAALGRWLAVEDGVSTAALEPARP